MFIRGSPGYEEAAEEVNRILSIIRNSGNRKPGAVLYVGHNQYHALKSIAQGDRQAMLADSFSGFPVIRVIKDDYVRFV